MSIISANIRDDSFYIKKTYFIEIAPIFLPEM